MAIGRFLTASFLTLALASTAAAQRGVSGHGGGGSIPHGGSAFQSGGFTSSPGFSGARSFSGSRGFAPSPSYRYVGGARPVAPYGAAPRFSGPASRTRPAFYQNRGNRRPVYGNHHAVGYGYPYGYGLSYGYPGWFDDDYLDTTSLGPYDNAADAPQPQPSDDAGPYYAPGSQQMAANLSVPEPTQRSAPAPVAPAEATTLVFKDGRPPEQIHSYIATHFTLTVFHGQRHVDIPIDDIDIAATQKANQAAGVNFQLP